MDIRPIRNDDDHREALAEIDRLWKAPRNTPDGDKLDVLVTLVEVYEQTRWPLTPSNSVQSDKNAQWAPLRAIWARGGMSEDFHGERSPATAVAR